MGEKPQLKNVKTPTNKSANGAQVKKRAAVDDFFSDLMPDDGSVPPPAKKKKKNIKAKSAVPVWGKGTGQHLQKYVKVKEVFDIETMIQKYVADNKVEVIEGALADQKVEEYKNNKESLHVKSSERQRLDRINNAQEHAKKSPEEIELEEYFKDSLHIDMTRTFDSMHLEKRLMKAIKYELKYTTPTPIQAATIPVALAGKDICGCAATGTGKTVAYMLPTLDRLLCAGRPATPVTRVVIIVPTRELGVQVFQVGQALVKYTNIKIALVCGGLNVKMQEREVMQRPDIIIATPGRLMTFLKSLEGFTLEHVEILVLDEADRILDEYFADQMKDIIEKCGKHRQTLLFSATMTTEVKKVTTAALNKPIKVFVNSNTNVAQGLRQEYIILKDNHQDNKVSTLAFLLINVFNKRTLVFLPTKILCHRMYVILRLMGINVGELHSKMPQSSRLNNLAMFSKGQIRVILATDLAARGLDIQGVDTVINYQLNKSYEMYVHRVGRTARAGKLGLAVTLLPEADYKMLKIIKRNSKTMMYERKVPQDEINVWKPKMDKLQKMATEILEIEKEAVKASSEGEILHQIEQVKYKAARQLEKSEKVLDKRRKKSELAEKAKAEGLSIKEYLQEKRLESNNVSNSQKKRVLRFKERQESKIFALKKKTLINTDIPMVKNKFVLKKRVDKRPSLVFTKK